MDTELLKMWTSRIRARDFKLTFSIVYSEAMMKFYRFYSIRMWMERTNKNPRIHIFLFETCFSRNNESVYSRVHERRRNFSFALPSSNVNKEAGLFACKT